MTCSMLSPAACANGHPTSQSEMPNIAVRLSQVTAAAAVIASFLRRFAVALGPSRLGSLRLHWRYE